MRTFLMAVVSLSFLTAHAVCINAKEESFVGRFKVATVTKLKSEGKGDEKNTKKFCKIGWQLELITGTPKLHQGGSYKGAAIYEVIETGELCDLKVGMAEVRKLVSVSQCCEKIKTSNYHDENIEKLRCEHGPIKWKSLDHIGYRL